MSLIGPIKARNLSALNAALENNPALNEPDKYGWSALHYAFALDYPEMAEALIARGASLTIKSKEEDTPTDLGLIFNSMGCLRLVQNQLSEDSRYKALLKYEADGIQVKKGKHGREKYLAYAELAKKYVQEERKIKAYNLPGRIDQELDIQHGENIKRYENIGAIFARSLAHNDGPSFFTSYIAAKTGIGNCDGQSATALLLCKRVFGLRKVEMFDISAKESMDPFMAMFSPVTDDEHVALVLGRNEPGAHNYRSWGENAVICDPWSNLVYPATEINDKFKKVVSIYLPGPDGSCLTSLQPFNPQTHALRFIEPQDRVRLPKAPQLTQYFEKRKEMSKAAKIQTLKEIAKLLPEDPSLTRVAEHKEANLKRFGS